MKNMHIFRLLLITISVLLIPLVAMQFTDEVMWTLFDFVAAFVLVFGTGFLFEFARTRSSSFAYRAASGLALLGMFLLVWVNGAVGIIGNEGNPINMLYFGVIAIIFLGSIIARFQPAREAFVLYAAAVAQMLVPITALFIAKPDIIAEAPGVIGVFVLNAFFAVLFVGSGLLFSQAEDLKR